MTKENHISPSSNKGWFQRGLIPHNKGKLYPDLSQEGSRTWKGDTAKYGSKHSWIHYNYGKASKCENEGCTYPKRNSSGQILTKPKFNWANISGEYKRDMEDWLQLCLSCHHKWDRGYLTIRGITKPKKPPYRHVPKSKVKTCEVCGKSHDPSDSRRKTCSKRCFCILLSEQFRKPNAPYSRYSKNACPSWAAQRKFL